MECSREKQRNPLHNENKELTVGNSNVMFNSKSGIHTWFDFRSTSKDESWVLSQRVTDN